MGNTCGVYEAMWLARLHASSASALYIHMPFCVKKCAYCDFSSWETDRSDAVMARYVASLSTMLDEAAKVGLLANAATAYIGGGTPSMLGAKLLGPFVSQVRETADLTELTCEANPESLDDEILGVLVEAGATRLSIGVQSLNNCELTALGRLHNAERAKTCVARAINSGLDVSIDLMCATPLQTDDSWQNTLREALDLGVRHISIYPLQIEEGTPLAQSIGDNEPSWHDSEIQAARMETAERMLSDAGLHRYEVASYAQPGHECKHNQAYWSALPYLGLGTSASSMLTLEAYQLLREVWPNLPELADGGARVRLTITSNRFEVAQASGMSDLHADLEVMSEGQAAAEDLMLGMRMTSGVDSGLMEHAREVLGAKRVDEVVNRCVGRGLAKWSGGRLVPTQTGWLLGNELYGEMWALASGDVRTVHV